MVHYYLTKLASYYLNVYFIIFFTFLMFEISHLKNKTKNSLGWDFTGLNYNGFPSTSSVIHCDSFLLLLKFVRYQKGMCIEDQKFLFLGFLIHIPALELLP